MQHRRHNRWIIPFALAILPIVLLAANARASEPDPELRRQHDLLVKQMADRSWCGRVAGQVAHPASLICPGDRDPADVVLRRTAALLNHLKGMEGAPDLSEHAADLKALQAQAQSIPPDQKANRYEVYEQACRLRRRIAFANPLLDFDRLIFLAKHRPMRGDHHMVDQYYGFNARPGGGIYVLSDPFGAKPKVRQLLTESTVQSGRLAGQKLQGGAFNTLDLDYDGKSILFAWSQCADPPDGANWSGQPWSVERAEKNRKLYYFWHPHTTYHVFRADLDGKNLQQLTDGPWNEFDPCFLPHGRIVFVSERRGGFLRCGGNRPNPTYTLYGMMGDGSDIIPISYHETHEWNPSVDNQGMIAYTRWDYVDRDNDGAHHIWLCYPDGRDPRSFHGNYPDRRELRPWMEMSIRAIPGSHRYVAVAAAHHGYNYGSLVLIDQNIEDDGAMSQLKRITPEAHLPESEASPGQPHSKGRHRPQGEVYGTPWPLSEEFHLCVYDPGQKHYGIYLIDAFGNRELIYRDPKVACLDPIPLRPRKRPPVIPIATTQAKADQEPGKSHTATVAVMNVYDADFEWPEDTKITALRIVQLYPKSTFHLDEPMVGMARESLTRGSLGTVPIESDGSAYFTAPAGAAIYFQALDERGLAVQSMRSLTYLHPGEQLNCQGCHEPKRRTPNQPRRTPLALQRPPSAITPEVKNADPITFARLVQPVLDRHCVDCHLEDETGKAPDLRATPGGKYGWTQSYHALKPYAWGLAGANGSIFQNGSRSTAGQVGAQASKLFRMLDKGHHDLKLPKEDLRRITLWLDCNSNFYGAYYDLKKQAAGEPVKPRLQ